MAEISHLPGPVADLWEWQYEGSCRDQGSENFYHPEGERGSKRRLRAQAAKEICAACPVMQMCRDHALRSREPFGVWGGLSEEERADLVAAADSAGTPLAG